MIFIQLKISIAIDFYYLAKMVLYELYKLIDKALNGELQLSNLKKLSNLIYLLFFKPSNLLKLIRTLFILLLLQEKPKLLKIKTLESVLDLF